MQGGGVFVTGGIQHKIAEGRAILRVNLGILCPCIPVQYGTPIFVKHHDIRPMRQKSTEHKAQSAKYVKMTPRIILLLRRIVNAANHTGADGPLF
jgi:hypothetical protein